MLAGIQEFKKNYYELGMKRSSVIQSQSSSEKAEKRKSPLLSVKETKFKKFLGARKEKKNDKEKDLLSREIQCFLS